MHSRFQQTTQFYAHSHPPSPPHPFHPSHATLAHSSHQRIPAHNTMHWHRLSPPSPSPIPSLPKTPPSRSRSGGGIGHSPTPNRYRKEYRIEWAKVSKTRFHECTCAILRFWRFWAFHTIIMGNSKDARTTHSERYATPPRRHSTRQALHLVFIADALSTLSSQCMYTLESS